MQEILTGLNKGHMKTVGRIAAGVFIFQIIVSMAVGMDTKEFVTDLLLENVHPGEPGKAKQIRMYSKRTGVSVEEIGKILLHFVEDVNLESDIRLNAISIIGRLRLKEALPVLKKIIRSENGTFHSLTIRAIVLIGGEGLTDFASEVINDHKQYNFFDRFTLYDQLSYWH